eukprot:scaffold83330_cov45-Attheya_sp.AAC.5
MGNKNVRIAVVGNVDSGKSTLIGTLTTGMLDDGRGKARSGIMTHRHEIETGRTSTVSTHTLAFHDGRVIPNAGNFKQRLDGLKSETEIAQSADQVVTFMDLAGHEKYLKTTIHGISSGMADYALILVNARHPPTHMTVHHMNICAAFGIPIIVLLTKIDGCPKHAFKETMDEIRNMVRSPNIGKKPFAIRNETDIETIKDKLQSFAPIMSISAVTGEGLDILQKLLHSLPKRRHHQKKLVRPFEFLVDGIFNVQGVGCVVSGFVNAGSVSLGDMIYVGPFEDGTFIKTTVKSFHIARTSVNFISAGVSACIAIPLNKIERKSIRNGMVVLTEAVAGVRTFEAEVCVLKGGNSKTFQVGTETVVHVLNVKQTATVQKIELINNDFITSSLTAKEDNVVLRPGNRAKIVLRFKIRHEYVRTGMRIVFRDRHVSGVGIITGIQ